jgi:hypothetical protein
MAAGFFGNPKIITIRRPGIPNILIKRRAIGPLPEPIIFSYHVHTTEGTLILHNIRMKIPH